MRTEQRDTLRAFLAKRNIQTGIHYPHGPLKLRLLIFESTAEEGAAWVQDETLLSLPIGEHLPTVAPVINAIESFLRLPNDRFVECNEICRDLSQLAIWHLLGPFLDILRVSGLCHSDFKKPSIYGLLDL